MLQQRGIKELLTHLPYLKFEIETNGTIFPSEALTNSIDLFVVSPKLAHAGDPQDSRIKETALTEYTALAWMGRAIFKFVAQNSKDLEQIADLIREHHMPHEAVWVMPEGVDETTHLNNLKAIADEAVS